jgi:hypothetical protein
VDTDRALRSLVSRTWLPHSLYFLIGGVWAVIGRRSFEAISGTKSDYWLVRTVGGMLAVVGAVIGLAGWRERLTPEIRFLAIGSSVVLTAIDIVYTSRRRISRVYLLDALANVTLIGSWVAALRHDYEEYPASAVATREASS